MTNFEECMIHSFCQDSDCYFRFLSRCVRTYFKVYFLLSFLRQDFPCLILRFYFFNCLSGDIVLL